MPETAVTMREGSRFILRPSLPPVFGRLQFANCKRPKTGDGEGLGMRLGKGGNNLRRYRKTCRHPPLSPS